MSFEETHPLKSIDVEIKQLRKFYEDFVIFDGICPHRYDDDFKELRDSLDILRSEFSVLWSQILIDNENLEEELVD